MAERLFLALPVYLLFKNEIDSWIEPHKRNWPDLKWTPLESLHITLHFFGDTENSEKKKILDLMTFVLAGEEAVPLQLEGIGAFPDSKHPKIVYIQVHRSSFKKLIPLQEKIVGVLRKNNFDVEARPYFPHVTTCRLKKETAHKWQCDEWIFPQTDVKRVDQVILYNSQLMPAGALHVPVKNWDLLE